MKTLMLAAMLLSGAAVACPGDFNHDGRTTIADNQIMRDHYGACLPDAVCEWDMDHDGDVDDDDLGVMKTLPDCPSGIFTFTNQQHTRFSLTKKYQGFWCRYHAFSSGWCQCSLGPNYVVTAYKVDANTRVDLPAPVPGPLFCQDVGLASQIIANSQTKYVLYGKIVVVKKPKGEVAQSEPGGLTREVPGRANVEDEE